MAGALQRHVHTADDAHRVTALELFFDLVFVYALTQVTALMADRTTWTGALEGLIVLSLLWFAWTAYAWLGNQAKADEGVLRVAVVAAMAAVFVVALAIPQAFGESDGDSVSNSSGSLDAALVLVLALVAARLVHLGVYLIAAGEDRGLRHQLILTFAPVSGWAALLVAGAFADGGTRLVLWALALVVDYGGIFVSSRAGGWRLNAAGHFAERHGLIIIIAIGESIVAIGASATSLPLTTPLLVAVLLGLAVSVTLWWSYFDVVAPVAERVLAQAQGEERARLARDSYTYLHFPMVVGIVFLALGMKKVVSYAADTEHHNLSDPLATVPLVALYGGVVLYLLAHIGFRLRNVHSVNVQRSIVAAVLVALLPVAARLPALAALGLLTALMVGLITYEVTRLAEARAAVRHAPR